ncbi:MAG: hypothetical protein RLZZ126_1244 [Pseudomonadota bacterium]|jgi:glycosyltransferase involved in cell wall biosynthesis
MKQGPWVLLARKLDSGGAERQLVALAKSLHAHGRDIHVVLFYPGGVFDASLSQAGVPVTVVGKSGRWDTVGFLWRLLRALRQIKPVGIYSFLDVANLTALLMSLWIGRPSLIWSVRAAGVRMKDYDGLTRLVAWLESRLSCGADLVIANSRAGQDWAQKRGFRTRRMEVVENGTDTACFAPQPEVGAALRLAWRVGAEEVLVGLVARLDPMKDHDNFLRACAILARQNVPWRFVCVGVGAAARQERLVRLADQLGLAHRIIWAGARQDVAAVYSALNLACSSSAHGEGFSNALAEAMACGVPCVATDVGDSARLLGALGEVVPPGDADSLAQGMQDLHDRLIREPELKDRVRQHICALYSLETMVFRTANLMDALTP